MEQNNNQQNAEKLLEIFYPQKEENLLTLPSTSLELGHAKIDAIGATQRQKEIFERSALKVHQTIIERSNDLYASKPFDKGGVEEFPDNFMRNASASYINCAFPATLLLSVRENPRVFGSNFADAFDSQMSLLFEGEMDIQLNTLYFFRAMLLAIKEKQIIVDETLPSRNDFQLFLKNIRNKQLAYLRNDNSSN